MKKDYKRFGRLHREMWTWLSENYGKKKWDWYRFVGDHEHPENYCYACEFCNNNCYLCPLKFCPNNWVDEDGIVSCPCEVYEKSSYYKIAKFWHEGMFLEEKEYKKLCRKIANMWPEKYRFAKEVKK